MASRSTGGSMEGNLLGGGSQGGWQDQGFGHSARPDLPAACLGGHAERGFGEMGRLSSRCGFGSGPSPQGDSFVQGRTGSLPGDLQNSPSYQASMDGQPGWGRCSRGRGGRDAATSGPRARAGEESRAWQAQEGWGAWSQDQLRKHRQQKEKEEEKEEARSSQDHWDQEPRSSFWYNRPGSEGRGTQGGEEESAAADKEEESHGLYGQLGELSDFGRESQLRGGRWPPFWRGGQSEEGLEKEPGCTHPEHPGAHANRSGHQQWPGLGFGPIFTPSNIFPILEAFPSGENVRSTGAGKPDALLPPGPASAGTGSCGMRRSYPEAQGPRADCLGGALQHRSASRAGADGDQLDDEPIRGPGSKQVSEGGGQSQERAVKAVGKKDGSVGQASRGRKRERKGQRQQRERKGQRRSAGSRRAQQRRQDKEVRLKGGGESDGSVNRVRESGDSGMMTGELDVNGFHLYKVAAEEEHGRGPISGSSSGAAPSSSERLEAPTGARAASLFAISPDGRTFGEMADYFYNIFRYFRESLKGSHSRVKCSGEIFPLPEDCKVISNVVGHLHPQAVEVLRGMCGALNSSYGVFGSSTGTPSAASCSALRVMSHYAADLCKSPEKFDGVQWEQFWSVKSIDYKGDEVRLAQYFKWENLEPAMPEGIASIPLSEVCELGTLDFVLNFEKYLLPEQDRVYCKPPKVMVLDEDWEQVCSGLLARGVCELIPASKVYHLGNKPLLSGLFGVPKDEVVEGWEVLRLIMNLVPVNRLCRNLGGDLATLPSWAGMTPYLLEENQVLVLSSEDIRCFFYLFETPPSWRPFMAFNKAVPRSLLREDCSEEHFLSSRVLPMGFLSSVSIAQHVHRRIARMSLHGIRPGVGAQSELRKDKGFTVAPWAYRIYLDNFDALERMDPYLANRVKGEVSVEVLALREGYQHWGLPRHPKKSVQQETIAEVQGALVDGVTGRVKPKPGKVLRYVRLAWLVLKEGRATQKQLQVICGGLVYCSMFRRPMLGMLNSVWNLIVELNAEPPVVKRELPATVKLELARFVCAIPLAQMNLRSPVLGGVTASDASETGGGFCISNGLTPLGGHAARCSTRGDLPEPEDHIQVLTVGLFDGIGALRVAADVLQLPMGGHVSAEVSVEGNRVLESNFPDTVSVGDVRDITDEMVLGWSMRFCNVGVVLVGGGPPCQGVSGLNSDRKGALKDARSSLFVHVKRVYLLCKTRFPWAQVHYMMESVFSMDPTDRATMSEYMGVTPFMLDAAGISVCRRPRLYWISWELGVGEGVDLKDPTGSGWEQYQVVALTAPVDAARFLCSGWSLSCGEPLPTFTTSRPRPHPGNRPAGLWQCQPWEVQRWKQDDHRYPPYVYRDKHCVINGAGDHRLPNIAEKEAAMGFPIGYTSPCLPKGKQHGDLYLDMRHTLIGNSWHVPIVAWLLKELFWKLGLTPLSTLDQVVQSASPGAGTTLQGYLRRPPLQTQRGQLGETPEHQLAKKLINFVSVKGEDLLLQAATENAVRFHRLRSSVPSKLWRWRVICGWQWQHPNHHINVLELNAILTTLRWRLCRRRQHSCRFIHLTDSLVCLHVLSRGRSSSRKLRSTLSKINSLLLASDAHPLWGYVATHQNPADRPSRRPVIKVCQKRKRT